MRILVVQHEDGCPPARLGTWLVDAGCDLDVRRPYAGEALPSDLTAHEALLVLGGEMGANDDHRCPWLTPTKALLRAAARDEVPTFGVCLGHQLIAAALGGNVARNPRGRQIGVLDVGWTDDAAADPLLGGLATPRRAAHWNEDLVVRPPPGGVVLAATARGEIQAMRFGPACWGVQWHPEATLDMIAEWAADDPGPHAARGLTAVRDAQEELELSWRDLGKAFASVTA